MAPTNDYLSAAEWDELLALKAAISDGIATVCPAQLERFSELFSRTLTGKGDTAHFGAKTI